MKNSSMITGHAGDGMEEWPKEGATPGGAVSGCSTFERLDLGNKQFSKSNCNSNGSG